jgi:gamma-glutamylputrescine oxidase
MTTLYRNDIAGEFPDSWYAATVDAPALRAPLDADKMVDVCVVGAGYTGLNAALHLARAGLSVIVLEAHRAGFGASGRNGGQVGSGYNQSQRWLAQRLGHDTARHLWDISQEAKADIRAASDQHPDIMFKPGVAHGAYSLSEAKHEWEDAAYLRDTYGYDLIDTLDRDAMQALVKTPSYKGGILDRGAGHIHPLRYALALAQMAETAGVDIYEQTEVTQITKGDPVTLHTPKAQVKARHVILAGNGYLPLLEDQVSAHVMPINSFICATEPLGDLASQVLAQDIAVADSKFVVNYFRLSEDKRLLFGGRESYSIGFPSNISSALIARMTSLFPQLKDSRVDYVWGGTLGITMSRLPAIQRVAPNIISGAGFSGHGVALSGMTGKVMAKAISGQAGQFDTLSQLPTSRFPGGSTLRAPLLALAMTWYALRDRLGA